MLEKDPARRLKKNIESLNIQSDDKINHTSENQFTEPTDIVRNSQAELALEEMHPTPKMHEIPDRTAFESSIMTNTQKTQPLSSRSERTTKDLRFEDPQEFLIKRCRGLEGALHEISRLPKRQLD